MDKQAAQKIVRTPAEWCRAITFRPGELGDAVAAATHGQFRCAAMLTTSGDGFTCLAEVTGGPCDGAILEAIAVFDPESLQLLSLELTAVPGLRVDGINERDEEMLV